MSSLDCHVPAVVRGGHSRKSTDLAEVLAKVSTSPTIDKFSLKPGADLIFVQKLAAGGGYFIGKLEVLHDGCERHKREESGRVDSFKLKYGIGDRIPGVLGRVAVEVEQLE